MAEDYSRCFPAPPLPPVASSAPNRSSQFDSVIDELTSHCWKWKHYEDNTEGRSSHHHSTLYTGSLGPCTYVRYRLAQSLSWNTAAEKTRKLQLLRDASQAAKNVMGCEPNGKNMRITLLEGGRVGALALYAAINASLCCDAEGYCKDSMATHVRRELLDIGSRYVQKLPSSECEVLYGRAGYLHAIAFVRSETNDEHFGKPLVRDIVKSILNEGERIAAGTDFPLLWEWHGKAYLGAIHGVAGILFTLLCFYEEISSIEGALGKIRGTIAKLDELCFVSGNLKSSFGAEQDKLVHLCHGSPGHILLLVKAYQVLDDVKYLEKAEKIARNVICKRGLLKKGVGLCHGISGNAYCFLSLYRGRKLSEQRTGETSHSESNGWLRWAYHFANFAVDNLDKLFWVPDSPHSLYNGASGLIMLLHDLKDPDSSRFPCFEP